MQRIQKHKKWIILGCVVITTLLVFTTYSDNEKMSYWIWSDSDMKHVKNPEILYLYQGDVGLRGNLRSFVKRGVNPSKKFNAYDIVPLIRIYKLPDPEWLTKEILYLANEWERLGVRITEIQIDHDSPSSKLKNYRSFIIELKRNIQIKKPNLQISITGLMTWYYDNPKELDRLAQEVEYIAFQLYSNFDALKESSKFIGDLEKYLHEFKLGITQSKDFETLSKPKTKNNLGKVTFLNTRDGNYGR